jgi:hypothetical protein
MAEVIITLGMMLVIISFIVGIDDFSRRKHTDHDDHD